MSGPRKANPAEKAKDEARKARLAAELRANLLKRKAKPKPRNPRWIGMRGDSVKGKGVDWSVGRASTGARSAETGVFTTMTSRGRGTSARGARE